MAGWSLTPNRDLEGMAMCTQNSQQGLQSPLKKRPFADDDDDENGKLVEISEQQQLAGAEAAAGLSDPHPSQLPLQSMQQQAQLVPLQLEDQPAAAVLCPAEPPTHFGDVREVHTAGVGGQVWIERGTIIFAKWSKSGREADKRWYHQYAGDDPQKWDPVPVDWW